jgi:hypothetical protein
MKAGRAIASAFREYRSTLAMIGRFASLLRSIEPRGNEKMRKALVAASMAAGLALSPAAAQNVPAEWTGAMQPDPMCMAGVAWEANPEAAPIRIYGCRPLSQIPTANAEGWVTYTRPPVNGNDAGFIMVKLIAQPSVSSWRFQVVDNQGGSGNFGFIVEGEADAQGFIQSPRVTIAPSAN